MIFTVYADKAEEVSKRLNKLAKKAARYNVPFSYTVSDEHPETVNVFDDFSLTKPAPTRSLPLILILLAKSLSRRTAGLFSLRSSTGTREMS